MKKKNKQNNFRIVFLATLSFVFLVVFGYVLSLRSASGRLSRIESDISSENKEIVRDLVEYTLKDEFIPKGIKLAQVPSATAEALGVKEYFASWDVGDEVFNILYTIKNEQEMPDFVRLWVMNLHDEFDVVKTKDLLSAYFKPEYLDSFEISCEVVDLEDGHKVKECGQMKHLKPYNLMGVTVKGPIPVSEAFNGQVVSVCIIPEGLVRNYPFKSCI